MALAVVAFLCGLLIGLALRGRRGGGGRPETTLQQADERYRALIELTHTGYLILDGAGRVLDANNEYVRLTGRGSLDAIRNRPVTEWTAPWDQQRNAAEVGTALAAGSVTSLEVDYQHPDGTVVPIEVNAAVIGPDRMLALCRDITSRRQAQRALRQSEAEARARSAELELVLNTVPAVVWIARDRDSREITGNPAAHQVLRMDHGQNLSKSAPDPARTTHFKVYQHGKELPPEALPVQVAAAQGVELEGTEVKVIFEDGDEVDLFGNVRPLWDDAGQPRGAVAAFVDITARKAAEAALLEAERNSRAVIDSSPLPILSLTAEGLVSGWNPAAERTFGYTRAEVIDHYFPLVDQTLDPEHRAWRAEILSGSAFSGRATRRRHKDGHYIEVSVSTAPIRKPDGSISGLVAIYEDISERREMERVRQRLTERMEEVRRLERLGVMAGGIAHDFNNLHTMILGNIHVARDELDAGSPALEWLQHAETAVQRASELTAQMLSYAGKGQFAFAPTEISAMLREMVPVMEGELSSRARLRVNLTDGLSLVDADVTQLQKLVIQLLRNADEALPPGGGEIEVRCGSERVDQEYLLTTVHPEAFPPGESVFIEVRDTGEGMAPDVIPKIFEPFFTTRFAGRGLGLPAVLGIARRHQATIRVESVPGNGTRMRVHFRPLRDGHPHPPESPFRELR